MPLFQCAESKKCKSTLCAHKGPHKLIKVGGSDCSSWAVNCPEVNTEVFCLELTEPVRSTGAAAVPEAVPC
jgi:hypothetical protein